MDDSNDVRQLLTEIRDAQRAHLEEYKKTAARALETQQQAVDRQASATTFIKRSALLGGLLIAFLLVLLFRLMGPYL